ALRPTSGSAPKLRRAQEPQTTVLDGPKATDSGPPQDPCGPRFGSSTRAAKPRSRHPPRRPCDLRFRLIRSLIDWCVSLSMSLGLLAPGRPRKAKSRVFFIHFFLTWICTEFRLENRFVHMPVDEICGWLGLLWPDAGAR